MRWTVLIPLKALPAAKSRLVADLDPVTHAELVEAIRADTVSAVRGCRQVARVVVVTDLAGEFEADLVLVQRSEGLNAALAEAADEVAERWPDDGVAALVGDLPALRAAELDAALEAAAVETRGFVADTPGTGTTLLTATPGIALEPRFGAGSAARHRQLAVALPAGATLRADVDTAADLAAAQQLGLGVRTAAVVAGLTLRPTVMSDIQLNEA